MAWGYAAVAAAGALAQSATSARMSSKQMAFQRELSSTAHQRQVADMRLAGLNPILSATGGRGASTPPGAQPGVIPNVGLEAGSAHLAAKQNRASVELLAQQTRLGRQQELTERSRTEEAGYSADNARIEAEARQRAAHGGGYIDARARELTESSAAAAAGAKVERGLDESSGEFLRTLRRLGLDAGTASQLMQLLRPKAVIKK